MRQQFFRFKTLRVDGRKELLNDQRPRVCIGEGIREKSTFQEFQSGQFPHANK